MKTNPYIFRGYDIRGLAEQDLNQEFAENLGKVFGTYLAKNGISSAVVGYDSRATSPEYSQAVAVGLTWAGLDVIDIGMELVGTFYWSQYHLNCRGGVYVTASHNPVEYNGFKLAVDFSETLAGDNIQEIRKMIEQDDYIQGVRAGAIRKESVREVYFTDILKRVPVTKKFKVVVDSSHSTAGVIAPDLLRQAGCEVVESNCELDSSFPLGTPDPTSIVVAERLKEKVLQEKANLGFSYDADGDRIGIVDEKGNIIWNDALLALFSIEVLNNHPGATIMFNTLCSKAVEETILKYGGRPFMWRVGHSFLKKKNQEVKAAFIGELAGHFFFSADFYNHDDGLYSTLRLLGYLSKTGLSLSEAVAVLPKYVSSPEIKIYCADDKKVAFIQKINPVLRNDFPDAKIIDDERAGDGIRVDTEDRMFVIRYSQNAPYLTVKFEARDEESYGNLRQYIKNLLRGYEEINWSSKINVNIEELEKQD